MIRVKICGLADEAGLDAAVAARADWIGFVFHPASPRFVGPARAAALSARAPSLADFGPARVGLFVDADPVAIAATLSVIRLDAVQIYGPCDPEILRILFRIDVWRAVGVSARGDLPDTARAADALVIEAKPPAGATRPGGNAVALDWPLLAGWSAPAPWLLAGGLTPDNVALAIEASGATAVDVSSGVESAPGIKDPARIAAFVAAARAVAPLLGDAPASS